MTAFCEIEFRKLEEFSGHCKTISGYRICVSLITAMTFDLGDLRHKCKNAQAERADRSLGLSVQVGPEFERPLHPSIGGWARFLALIGRLFSRSQPTGLPVVPCRRRRVSLPSQGIEPGNGTETMKSTLIKCGWLVTLDPSIGEMKDGELLYLGNAIKAAGRTSTPAPTRPSTPPTRS